MAGLSQSRSSPKLTAAGQLLGQRSSQARQPTTVARSLSVAMQRRRHSTDTVNITPQAYTGKFIGTTLLKKNRTVENTSDTARPSSEGLLAMAPLPQKRADAASDTDALACRLALKHRLMYSEVKSIVKEFSTVKRNEAGGMHRAEFDQIMAKIFDVPKVDARIAAVAYKVTGADSEIDVEKFLDWYVQNMFTQVNALNGDAKKFASDALCNELAREHGVSPMDLDNIKKKFDKFDLDGGGSIEFDEFEEMMRILLKAKSVEDLNPKRIQRFWNECDRDSSETIDFPEFVAWWLKYFGASGDMDSNSLSEAYYESFDPTAQRRRRSQLIHDMSSVQGA